MKTKSIALLLLVFLTSCGSSAPQRSESDVSYQNTSKTTSAPAPTPGSREGGSGEQQKPADVTIDQADKSKTAATERKIIRNADLNLEASAPEEAQQKISAIAESKGGFVVESRQSSSSSNVTVRDTVTMTVRVPAAKFNESLDEIRKVSSRVISETIKGQDVTEEFVDIEARLKAKKALEAQFLEIMKQGKTVQDALSVQRELANVRAEIEQIEGRLRFLENQTSLSTITVKIQSPTALSANPTGFFYQLWRSMGTGFDIALNIILGLVTFVIAILPLVLFVVLPIYLLLRYFWRRIRTRTVAKEIIDEEIKTE